MRLKSVLDGVAGCYLRNLILKLYFLLQYTKVKHLQIKCLLINMFKGYNKHKVYCWLGSLSWFLPTQKGKKINLNYWKTIQMVEKCDCRMRLEKVKLGKNVCNFDDNSNKRKRVSELDAYFVILVFATGLPTEIRFQHTQLQT